MDPLMELPMILGLGSIVIAEIKDDIEVLAHSV